MKKHLIFGRIKLEFLKNELFVWKETSGISEKVQVVQIQKFSMIVEQNMEMIETDPELYPGGENERYLEIWNLSVFRI